eukprot:294883-Rhodomonas_salina.1
MPQTLRTPPPLSIYAQLMSVCAEEAKHGRVSVEDGMRVLERLVRKPERNTQHPCRVLVPGASEQHAKPTIRVPRTAVSPWAVPGTGSRDVWTDHVICDTCRQEQSHGRGVWSRLAPSATGVPGGGLAGKGRRKM